MATRIANLSQIDSLETALGLGKAAAIKLAFEQVPPEVALEIAEVRKVMRASDSNPFAQECRIHIADHLGLDGNDRVPA